MANYFDTTHIESAIEPEVSDQNSNNELKFKLENIFDNSDVAQYNTITVEISTDVDVKQPKLNDDGSFYIIYSTEKIKLRPRDSAMLNLRLKVNLPDGIEGMIGLLPSFVARKLSIENSNWISNKRKDEIIQLGILNKNFYNTIDIRKKSRNCVYISN